MIVSRRLAALGAVLALATPPAAAITFAGPANASGPMRYTYVDLGSLGSLAGPGYSRAHDINASARVVGYTSTSSTAAVRAFDWRGGVMTNLGAYYASSFALSSAQAVNDHGHIVGHGQVNDTEPSHALLFRDGRIQDLGTGLGSGSGSAAHDINDSGVVVGSRFAAPDAPQRAVIWRNGQIRELGSLGGSGGSYGVDSVANAVNDSGLVVGAAQPRSGPLHAFVWNGRRMRDLGTLGGNNEATVATDINDIGQVTGQSPNVSGRVEAFLWQNGTMRSLGAPRGAASSHAEGINNRAQVVGSAVFGEFLDPEAHIRAAVSVNGVMTELQPLVDAMPPDVTLWSAFAINDDGVIVGSTCLGKCYTDHRLVPGNAFLLVPRS